MTKQIDIQVKIKKLPKGWVAMDKNEKWCWFQHKPIKHFGEINKWLRQNTDDNWGYLVNIKPVSDWTKSLIRINESQNNLCITDDTPHLESTVLFLDLLENKDE